MQRQTYIHLSKQPRNSIKPLKEIPRQCAALCELCVYLKTPRDGAREKLGATSKMEKLIDARFMSRVRAKIRIQNVRSETRVRGNREEDEGCEFDLYANPEVRYWIPPTSWLTLARVYRMGRTFIRTRALFLFVYFDVFRAGEIEGARISWKCSVSQIRDRARVSGEWRVL